MTYVQRDFRVQKCCSECGRPFEDARTKEGVTFDLLHLERNKKVVRLSVQHALMFETLFKIFPKIATRDAIFSNVWGNDSEIEEKTIDVIVCNLRKKLKPLNIKIVTVWGVGYRLVFE